MLLVLRALQARLPAWLVLPLVLASALSGATVGRSLTLSTTSPCPLDTQICAGFTTFWSAWEILSSNYVDPKAIDPIRMTDGAIAGMVDSLGDDGHTRYLPPEIAKAERESLRGRFEGIGVYLDVRDGQPVVIEPIDDSPAQRAGLRAGDRIIAVNGESVRGVTLDKLRTLVRGPSGTSVTLTIQHLDQADTVEITVVRGQIDLASTTWRMLPGQIAFIRLNEFSARAGTDIRKALTEARQQGAAAIVLDLRNNPGGLVEQLMQVASEFLPKGTTVLLEQDRNGNQTPYTTRDGGSATDLPLAVLVNANSASSAEILAAALGEAGRASVIGEPTFGTATVLRTFALDNGGELRVGTTQWLTPKGELVRGKGITPNEIVELPAGIPALTPAQARDLTPETLQSSGDTQLLRAIELLGALMRQ